MRKGIALVMASLLVSSMALAQLGGTSKPGAQSSTTQLEPGHGKREADFVLNKERERIKAEEAEQAAAQKKGATAEKPRTQKNDKARELGTTTDTVKAKANTKP